MKNQKIVQLDTPHVQQVSMNKARRRKVHLRRIERIVLVFAVLFIVLGVQIIHSRQSLAVVNSNIHEANAQLTTQKNKSKDLQQEIKQLHDPEYLQQVVRSKYNYSKKGETIYNLDD